MPMGNDVVASKTATNSSANLEGVSPGRLRRRNNAKGVGGFLTLTIRGDKPTSAKDRPLSCQATLICSTTQNCSELHTGRSVRASESPTKPGAAGSTRELAVDGECTILTSFLGAGCSRMEIERNQTAATATRIYKPLALSVSRKVMAT